MMYICDYGCGQEANYQVKNGKRCCNKSKNSCSKVREKNSNINKGRIFSDETKEKMRKNHPHLSGKNHPMYGKDRCGEKNGMYGKKHTTDAIEKMREARKGKIPWNKNKTGIYSNDMIQRMKEAKIGKKHTPETKEKMSIAKKGKPLLNETKKKMSEAAKGEKNGMWRGGTSYEPYCEVWLDKEYKNSIKERDNYKCQNIFCKRKHIKLHIHHINYDKKDCKPYNLITLCNSCNSKANTNREWYIAFYKEIIRRKY